MIVVDTNLLIYLLMPTPHFAVAEAIWTKDGEWVAPELVFSEFWNVLAGAARRKNC
jgi:predicted nucleic acid-binding protein